MEPDDNGLKQGIMVPGLEPHTVSKTNDSLPESEATVSGVEQHTDTVSNDYDKPYGGGEQRPRYDSPSSSDESDSSESPRSESFDQAQQWSMISVSPRAGAGNFSSELFSPSTMKPPRCQTINRPPPGYDPNRIPSSVFTPGPTTPMDWSAASNDSLFSIHMNSFSRDHFSMQGDFKHNDDWYCNTPLHTYNNISEPKSDLPPVVNTIEESPLPLRLSTKKTDAEEDLQEFEKEKLPAGDASEARLSVTSSNLSDDRRLSSAEEGRHSGSAMHHSNESAHSSGSFAFPLLVEEGGRNGTFKVASPKTKEEEALPQPQNQTEATTPDPDPVPVPEQANSNWLSCIMCRFRCCF